MAATCIAFLMSALALLACSRSPAQAEAPSESPRPAPPPAAERIPFDSARAWDDLATIVAFGPRPSASPANAKLRDWIAAQVAAAGATCVRQPFRAATPKGDVAFENLYVDLPASRSADAAPWVILGSHFDTKLLPFTFLGANDGGSSTAVLLELTRALAKVERRVNLRCLFLDGEEAVRIDWEDPDNRYGSRHHVASLRESGQLERVKAFVLLDLVGDRDLRLNREEYSTPALLEMFVRSAHDQGLERHYSGAPRELLDDHLSFLQAGVPSLDLIDFEYGPGNAYWHSEQDTLEHCSRASLEAIGRIVLGAYRSLEDFALAGR